MKAMVEQHRIEQTRVVEMGPRAWAASIPENATPFMLPLIWREWEGAFYRVNFQWHFHTEVAQ